MFRQVCLFCTLWYAHMHAQTCIELYYCTYPNLFFQHFDLYRDFVTHSRGRELTGPRRWSSCIKYLKYRADTRTLGPDVGDKRPMVSVVHCVFSEYFMHEVLLNCD